MKYKEFKAWCNERTCDGRWGMIEAMTCIDIITEINSFHFWKREKLWKEVYEHQVLDEIVTPTNNKIKRVTERRL